MRDILFLSAFLFPLLGSAQVGISTPTPQKTLHVNGSLQVVNEFNVGGDASTAGNAGTPGQVLVSNGSNAAPSWQPALNALGSGNPGDVFVTTGTVPSWQPLGSVSGTIASVNYVQGTTALTINQGVTSDVPGVSITLTVPAGKAQTFLFSILGYALRSTTVSGQATQGVFSLLRNGTKISSAYVSSGDGGNLVNLPSPVTFLKSVSLEAGTYTFKVQYSAWSGAQTVNFVPATFAGYNGDTEAMLTKMQVLVYNN